VDGGELGIRAGELAQKLELEEAARSWLGDVGEAEITGAAVMREDVFGDGRSCSSGLAIRAATSTRSAC
jgi:hypothetical protein